MRYADLLRTLPGFGEATLDPAVAVQPPTPWRPQSGAKRSSAGGSTDTTAITEVVTRVLGASLAGRIWSEAACPALEAALRRAQRCGHNPAALLDRLARTRELRTAHSISEVLAWRIGGYLIDECGASAGPTEEGTQKLDPQTWAMLAWTLKTAENSGYDIAEAIASASHAPDPASALFALTRTVATHQQAPSMPPWISKPGASSAGCSDAHSQIARYLNTAADEIRKRVQALTVDAADSRPAWVNALGAGSGDDVRHREWRHHVGVVAAYRDQYQVSSDDPRQVLGPCAEPGHAGHTAYWHAAESVLTARTLAGLEPAGPPADQAGTQVPADLYLSLPAAKRAAVSTAMAERLGVLWFGGRTETDDLAVTRPMYVSELARILAERGHLTRQMAARATLADPLTAITVVNEGPVEVDYARCRTGQRDGRNNPRACGTWHTRAENEVTPSPGSFPARLTAAGPTEQGNDPMFPPHRLSDQHRGAAPV